MKFEIQKFNNTICQYKVILINYSLIVPEIVRM